MIQIALTLLLTAMSLLTQVNNSPNISPQFKTYAETVANQAISYAQLVIAEETKNPTTTTVVPVPPVTTTTPVPPIVTTTVPVQPVVTAPKDLSKLEVVSSIYYDSDNGFVGLTRSDTTFDKSKDRGMALKVTVFDKSGSEIKLPVTVTTDDPDIPFTFSVNGPGVGGGFAVGEFENEHDVQHGYCKGSVDCKPVSVGTFTFNLTQPELGLSKSIQITVK